MKKNCDKRFMLIKWNCVFKIFFYLIPILFLLCSCSKKVSLFSANLLGTVCSVNAFEQESASLNSKIFSRLSKIDSMFNVNLNNSDLTKVNNAAGINAVTVNEEVAYVLKNALEYSKKTEGAFDPTIGPLVKLWGINTDHERVPSDEEINSVLPLVNYKNLEINSDANGSTVFLLEPKMSIDLGGIAKGYAADEIVKILQEENIERAIIDLGGNIFVYGQKPDKSDWKVGIKNPFDKSGTYALVVSLKENSTVVTSGVYERNFIENGIVYHHILNPKNGRPADSTYLSSTIISDSSMKADALSTVAFILGPEKYFALFSESAIFIRNDGLVIASKNLEGKISERYGVTKIEYR